MTASKAALLALLALVCVILSPLATDARCPHLDNFEAEVEADTEQPTVRKLLQSTLPADYFLKAADLFKVLVKATEGCRFSSAAMAYNSNPNVVVDGEGVFFPSASWLRAFFHDAGTFVAKKSLGGPRGGPNGSLGLGCSSGTCGDVASGAPAATLYTGVVGGKCDNGADPVNNFEITSDPADAYCCPGNTCVAKGDEQVTPKSGKTAPVCVPGTSITNELCRRENDGLLPTMQFFRKRQADAATMYTDIDGTTKKPISFADIIVMGAAAAVKSCSLGGLALDVYVGRADAVVVDAVSPALPSPGDVIAQTHADIFQRMGLDKKDMATLLTGTHTVGGFRHVNSPGLTDCPYVPFDCTPGSQLGAAPFDNNVFKVACDGILGVTKGACAWNDKCTNPSTDETVPAGGGCPFGTVLQGEYAACSSGPNAYPIPGLISDIHLCQDLDTQATMVKFAQSQSYFFTKYGDSYQRMATLGYSVAALKKLVL